MHTLMLLDMCDLTERFIHPLRLPQQLAADDERRGHGAPLSVPEVFVSDGFRSTPSSSSFNHH